MMLQIALNSSLRTSTKVTVVETLVELINNESRDIYIIPFKQSNSLSLIISIERTM